MLCVPKFPLSFPLITIIYSEPNLLNQFLNLSINDILLFPFNKNYIDSRLEEDGEALGRNWEKRQCYRYFYTHTHTQSELKIVQGWFRKRSRCDNLRLSFLFLLDYRASYCFNLVFQIYFLYSSSILPVTRGFYCYEISCQEICCRWEHL